MRKSLYIAMVAVLLSGSIAYASYSVNASATGADHTRNSHMKATSDDQEHIDSVAEMHKFHDIKHGKDLFGIRKIENSVSGHKTHAAAMITADSRVCVAAAITKKDGALKTALTAFTTKTEAAIDARTTCQVNAIALGSANEQQSANMTCKATYQSSTKGSLKDLVMARNGAWKAYRTELKACVPVTAETEIKVEDGGDQINGSL